MQYKVVAGAYISSILEDHEGTIWIATVAVPTGRICAIRQEKAQCAGEDGSLGAGANSLYEDSHQNLWVGAATGLWQWKPGPPRHFPLPAVGGAQVSALLERNRGELLVGTPRGIYRFAGGVFEPQLRPGGGDSSNVRALLHDRDGTLWIGTHGGLFHVHAGRTDSYTHSDGLTGDLVTSLYEDREGNVWVGTLDGLDKFRGYAIPTISRPQGLQSVPLSVLSGPDGSLWICTDHDGLDRWELGDVANYHIRHPPRLARTNQYEQRSTNTVSREIVEDALGEDEIRHLAKDEQGRIWAAGHHTLSSFENGRFFPAADFGAGQIVTISSDRPGGLWVSHSREGLIHFVDQRIAERTSWSTFGTSGLAVSLIADPRRGGIWLGFLKGGIAFYQDNRLRAFYGSREGLGQGRVMSLFIDEQGALWAATEGGLSLLKDGRVMTLTVSQGLPCPVVQWVIADDSQSFWLGTACGVVRIDGRELKEWASGILRTIHPIVFDTSDGVRSHLGESGATPTVTKSPDGRIWFTARDGVSLIDPRHLVSNPLLPPVHVEQVIANHKAYGTFSAVTLPPLVRDLEFQYTALSLVAPEKLQFRYKLEGHDGAWQDAGNRRQAFYTDLPPGAYHFHVIASNNSGVWNTQGDTLLFTIAPAYWQTNWFRALCALAILGLLWMAYLLRMRQLRLAFNVRLEARVGERMRIARDLHDTLLQSFQGLLLRFQTVAAMLPTRAEEAKNVVLSAVDQAAQAITEGRRAVQGLRSQADENVDFATDLRTAGELAARETGNESVTFRVEVEGSPRTLHPIVRDDVYRIACEALRNAFRHAQARQIEVELEYHERQLRLRVRDDGQGVDPKILEGDGQTGHFGLHGMRERAKLIDGQLDVWSAPGSGTEVEVTIPASRAYAPFRSADRRDSE